MDENELCSCGHHTDLHRPPEAPGIECLGCYADRARRMLIATRVFASLLVGGAFTFMLWLWASIAHMAHPPLWSRLVVDTLLILFAIWGGWRVSREWTGG